VLLSGQCAYATNNIIVVEAWVGSDFPQPINIPEVTITELLRIPMEPVTYATTENSITFYYADGTWLHSALYASTWPDVSSMMDGIFTNSNLEPIPESTFEAVERLRPFIGELGMVYLLPGAVSTSPDPDKDGATIKVPGMKMGGIYNAEQLLKLKGIVATIDLDLYPLPSPFLSTDQTVRGGIIGMRL